MKLTNDDFARSEHGITFDREFDDPEQVIDQILKNQAEHEYYQKFDTEHDMLEVLAKAENYDELNNKFRIENLIVERLKKRIEELSKQEYFTDVSQNIVAELQKILDGKE